MKINRITPKKAKTELVLDNVVAQFELFREPYESNNKVYYNYFVNGSFAGKDKKVYFTPNLNKTTDKETFVKKSDRTSYELLDVLYGDRVAADMYVSIDTVTQKGEIKEVTKYVVVVTDDVTGDTWLPVAPDKNSDKAVIENMIVKFGNEFAAADELEQTAVEEGADSGKKKKKASA